jgi:hypothetical protein
VIVIERAKNHFDRLIIVEVENPIIGLLAGTQYANPHLRIAMRLNALAHFMKHAANIGTLMGQF